MKYKKIDLSKALLYGIEEDALTAYVDHRAAIKKPLQQRTFDRIIKAALECQESGICPATEALDIAVDNGWTGLKPDWVRNKVFQNARPVPVNTKQRTLVEDLTDRSWAK